MLGFGSETVSAWSLRFMVCVMNYEAAHSDCQPFGGKDMEVESDECEIGRKRKGLHGHDTDVKGDFRGLLERSPGRIFGESYEKIQKDSDERRFGPPTIENVRHLVDRLISGSVLLLMALVHMSPFVRNMVLGGSQWTTLLEGFRAGNASGTNNEWCLLKASMAPVVG